MAEQLSARGREITETVVRLRLVTGKQLERLHFAEVADPGSRARQARRACARLVQLGVLARLARRVGGVRAGAGGYTYYADAGAQRLAAFWRGEGLRRVRSRYEPSPAFVRHALGISECYVRLLAAERAGRVELLEFQSEPTAWRTFNTAEGLRHLKPDAFVRLGLDQATELHAFLEIDCATEGRVALARKCHAYVVAWRSGMGGAVFPRVVWITVSQRRAELLREVCTTVAPEAWPLFAVTTPERALEVLTTGAGS